jgi:hypothetical protein
MVRDAEPPDHHGLARDEAAPALLDFSMQVKDGVFFELATELGFTVARNHRLSMRDFAANAIELAEAMEDYFGEPRRIFQAGVKVYLRGGIEVTLSRKASVLEGGIPNPIWNRLLDDFTVESEDEMWIHLKNKTDAVPLEEKATALFAKHFLFSVFQDRTYYLNANPASVSMQQAAAYYGLMQILGTIVRYRPTEIHKYLDEKGTSHKWFLQKACDAAERVYPNLMLNLLTGQNYKYVTSLG